LKKYFVTFYQATRGASNYVVAAGDRFEAAFVAWLLFNGRDRPLIRARGDTLYVDGVPCTAVERTQT
jgi:hypothetical protein